MGSAVFPAPSAGGGIKLVQRGNAASAGNITITGVDTTKAFISSFSTASTGDVGTTKSEASGGSGGSSIAWASSINFGSSWSASAMGAYIVNSTTITATGACRWEVVEFA